VLLDDWVAEPRRPSREEALGLIALRYFRSHGPATAKDFRWWASLPLTEIKRGLEMVGSAIASEVIDGVAYWFAPTPVRKRARVPRVHFLQPYDELVVGYTESRATLDIVGLYPSAFPEVYGGAITVDGQMAGSYKQPNKQRSTLIKATLFRRFSAAESEELEAAAARLGQFTGLPLHLTASART
jgi:hypothetical protein